MEENASSFKMWLNGCRAKETSCNRLEVGKKEAKNHSMLNIYNSILHNIDGRMAARTNPEKIVNFSKQFLKNWLKNEAKVK
jgi:hypothetical protein